MEKEWRKNMKVQEIYEQTEKFLQKIFYNIDTTLYPSELKYYPISSPQVEYSKYVNYWREIKVVEEITVDLKHGNLLEYIINTKKVKGTATPFSTCGVAVPPEKIQEIEEATRKLLKKLFPRAEISIQPVEQHIDYPFLYQKYNHKWGKRRVVLTEKIVDISQGILKFLYVSVAKNK